MKFWKAFCVLCLTLTMILSMAACTGSHRQDHGEGQTENAKCFPEFHTSPPVYVQGA